VAEETKTMVVTIGGYTIAPRSPANKLVQMLGKAPEGDIAFMRIDDTEGRGHWVKGRGHWVNIHAIIDIYETE
jgi:hypothetical protein